jgi:hypothetical protein
MSTNRPVGSVEHNLLHALQWEIHDFRVADKLERWNLNEDEAAAVEKWILNRIEDIKSRIE